MNKNQGKEKEVEAQLKRAVKALSDAGITSFVIGLDTDGLVTTHYEKITMKSVSRIVISLFQQACDYEASQGQMSTEYRATMREMKEHFLGMIKSYNARFAQMAAGGKTKTA